MPKAISIVNHIVDRNDNDIVNSEKSCGFKIILKNRCL